MFRPTWCGAQRFLGLDVLRRSGWAGVLVGVAIGSVMSCSVMPSLEEQERHVRDNELVLHQLTPRAFVGAWGAPTYQHAEFMQFFGMKDDELIPRSRLASGVPPRGWEVRIEAGDAFAFAHIHSGAAGTNGPVILDLAATAADFNVTKILSPGATVITALKNDPVYVNAHSTNKPGGIIRGQIR